MVSNIYINQLVKRAHTDEYARWRLGEILHEAEMEGYEVRVDKVNKLISVKEKYNESE